VLPAVEAHESESHADGWTFLRRCSSAQQRAALYKCKCKTQCISCAKVLRDISPQTGARVERPGRERSHPTRAWVLLCPERWNHCVLMLLQIQHDGRHAAGFLMCS
jgi:hypothetical protein